MRKREALGLLAAAAAVALTAAGCGSVASGSPAAGSSQADGTQSIGSSLASAHVLLCEDASAVGPALITHENTIEPYIDPGGPIERAQTSTPAVAEPSAAPSEPVRAVDTTPATARWLARALCALPLMTTKLLNCPLAIPDEYTLVFTLHGRQLPAVTVQTSGCRQVTGVGSVRSASQGTVLLQKLAALAGSIDNGGPVHGLPAGG